MLRNYQPQWLAGDVIAGLVLATVLVPVGVAYASAAGLPGICGLYATIVPLLVYALFGPSPTLVLGPDSSLVALILVVVVPLSGHDPQRAIALASMMAIVSGAVCILAGLGRLGFVTELLSKPIRYGYMNGIALTVLISQVPRLFGFSIDSKGPLRDLWAIGREVLGGHANWVAFAVGVLCLAAVLSLKRFPRIPAIAVAMAAATLIVGGFDLSARAGVAVVGSLPQGLPAFTIPHAPLTDLVQVAIGGCAIAIVSFADSSVLSRTFAARRGLKVDPNQELIGLGAANLAAGFFQGFSVSASSSRTPVAEAAGARTQLAGVVGALAVTLLLVAAPELLKNLPSAALAAVVIASAIGLIQVTDLVRIFRVQPWEFWLSIVCLAGVAVLGVIPGIGLAIGIAIIEFLWDGWRPYSAVLGRPEGLEGYHDIGRHPDAHQLPGLILFRWDAPLFFANAEFFTNRVLALTSETAGQVRWLVVAAEPVTSIDVTSADAVAELARTLRAAGVKLCFAELKGPVKDKFRRFGLTDVLGEGAIFRTLEAAVRTYQAQYEEAWRAPDPAPGGPDLEPRNKALRARSALAGWRRGRRRTSPPPAATGR